MADDLVTRLREHRASGEMTRQLLSQAAAEIARLRGLLIDHGRHDADCKFGDCWCQEARRG